MELYTIAGDRPDLNREAIRYNRPEGYIGNQILPLSYTSERTGEIYYKTATPVAPAQTNRETATAPTDTLLTDSHTTFSVAETIKRGSVAEEEVKTFGGIERADVVGARFAVRSVVTAIEGGVADLTLKTTGAADYDFVVQTAIHDIQKAIDAVEDYAGDTVLVASRNAIRHIWLSLLQDSRIYASLSRIVNGRTDLNFDAWAEAVRELFGVDRVLVGHNSVWDKGTRGERFAVAKLYNGEDELAHKYDPIFGVMKVFLPDPAAADWPFKIMSIPDRNNHSNHYDAQIWAANVVLNAGAVKVFDLGIDNSDSGSASGSASA